MNPNMMALIQALKGGSMHPPMPQQPGAFNPQGSVLGQASDQYLNGPMPMEGLQMPSSQEPQPGMVPGMAGLPPGPPYTGQLPITQQPPVVAAQKRY